MGKVVVGLGTVGLTTAIAFAKKGCSVLGLEKDVDRLAAIRNGSIREVELRKDLRDVLSRALAVNDSTDSMYGVDAVIICVSVEVDTKGDPLFGSLNGALSGIAGLLKKGMILSIETTLPPGAMRTTIIPCLQKYANLVPGKDYTLVYAPERIAMSRLLWSIENLPRVVSGLTLQCRIRGKELYSEIAERVRTVSSFETAEMVKVVENSYRDVNIAFANEVAKICYYFDVNPLEVRQAVNDLPDIKEDEWKNPVRNMHIPGIGVGGHCVPKDSQLLLWSAKRAGKEGPVNSVITAARSVNNERPFEIVELIMKHVRGTSYGSNEVLLLGWAFSPDVSDDRNSPAKKIYEVLVEKGVGTRVHDPYCKPGDLKSMVAMSDILVLCTPHQFYRNTFTSELMEMLESEYVVRISYFRH